jgi:hypothetical protein
MKQQKTVSRHSLFRTRLKIEAERFRTKTRQNPERWHSSGLCRTSQEEGGEEQCKSLKVDPAVGAIGRTKAAPSRSPYSRSA